MADTCRSCGSPIRWAVTAGKGRRIPLDPEPTPDGNITLSPGRAGGAPVATVAAVGVLLGDDGTARYTSHFATCPDAARHRRTR